MVGGVNSYLNSYYSMANNVSSVSSMYDYKAAQQQTQSIVNTFKNNNAQVKALKDDTSKFLTEYTGSMNSLQKASAQLTNGGVDKLLYDKQGNITDETVKKTTDAVQNMVDAYNSSLKMLNTNADRGEGVVNQIARMADDPASKEAMDLIGITVNDNATLSLDVSKLTEALKTDNPDQLKLYKDALGGSTGVAAGVQRDARAGLNTSAGSLVGNDIAMMQSIRADDPLRSFGAYARTGAYTLNNMAAAGMLMNLFA